MKRILTVVLVVLLQAGPASAHRHPAGLHPQRELVHQYVVQYFPANQVHHAMRVANCESGFDPGAIHHNRNGTHDYGVFQLNSGGTMQSLGLTPASAMDPETNIAAAYRLWRKRGWSPWVCSA